MAVLAGVAAPEAVPLLARGGAALKEAATRAETAANNAAVNAFGKAANVAGKVSPKAGEMVLKPTIYNAAKDVLTSYAPSGAQEPTKSGYVGGGFGMRKEIMNLFPTTTDDINKSFKTSKEQTAQRQNSK